MKIVQNAITAPNTDAVFLVLLSIDHDDLAAPIYCVNNNQAVTSTIPGGSTLFLATAFNFVLGRNADGEVNNAQLTIDNVDRRIVQAVRTISSPATVTAWIIMASDPNTIVQGPWNFELLNVTYNSYNVSGDLVFKAYLEEIAGTVFFPPNTFPGLYGS